MGKEVYFGKFGNVCEHIDFPFQVVTLDGKHIAFLSNFKVAQEMVNKPLEKAPVVKEGNTTPKKV
jgi:hypothetical protein